MATISELIKNGTLHQYDPELPANELELRMFLASERVARWVEETLPTLVADMNRQLTPEQEFSALMETYCGGTVLEMPRDFHPMLPVGRGIWELRTIDLRLFGWFPFRDVFVAVSAHTAKHVKDNNLYGALVQEAVKYRDRLDLDEPKFVEGDDPNAVVSNHAYTT